MTSQSDGRAEFEKARQRFSEDLALFRGVRELLREGGGVGSPHQEHARKIAQAQAKESLYRYVDAACRAGLDPDNSASHAA